MKFKPTLRILVFHQILFTVLCVAVYNNAFSAGVSDAGIYAFLVSLLVFGYYVLQRLFTSYQITDGRVSLAKGILWRRSVHIPIARITDTAVSRRLLQRLLGVGTVFVNSAGSDITEMTLQDVTNADLNRARTEIDRLIAIEKAAPAPSRATAS